MLYPASTQDAQMKTFEMQTLAGLENKAYIDKVLMGSDSNFHYKKLLLYIK